MTTPFPPLGAAPNEPLFAIERLGADPASWESADLDQLQQLLVLQCVRWARGDAPETLEPLQALYGVFVERAPDAQRMSALEMLGSLVETVARDRKHPGVGAAGLIFLHDSSPAVVATAAMQVACLLAPDEADPLSGPKAVAGLSLKDQEPERRAAVLAGVLAIGDARITDLLDGCWEQLSPEAYRYFAQLACGQFPSAAVIDFFLRWAEASLGQPAEPGLGDIAAALTRLAVIASRDVPGAGPCGVLATDRALPVWTRPEDQSVTLVERWSREEYGRMIAPRLVEVARRESYPRILPTVLAAWGIADVPHLEAVAEAVEPVAADGGDPVVLAEPASVGTLPGWQPPGRLVEWGILNPDGPTLCQLSLVPLDDGGRQALVWTRHHFLAADCVVWAVGSLADRARLLPVLTDLFAANGSGGYGLMGSLPHWVNLPDDGPIDAGAAAALIGAAHRRWSRDHHGASSEPDADVAVLSRLFEDPVAEIARQEEAALAEAAVELAEAGEAAPRPASPAAPDEAAYRRWLDAASAPAHVEKLRGHFESAWGEALRRYHATRT